MMLYNGTAARVKSKEIQTGSKDGRERHIFKGGKMRLIYFLFYLQLIPFIQQVPQFIQGVSADQLQAQFEDPYRNKKKPKDTRRR